MYAAGGFELVVPDPYCTNNNVAGRLFHELPAGLRD
jgi:hypothetical protein